MKNAQVHRRGQSLPHCLLDVAQAFDKVWHEGLFHKIEQLLPAEYSQLLKSYLSDRYFRVKQEDEY